MVHMTIDGLPVEVEKGTLLIRAAEQVGVRIPRFCDHPLLAPSANCRQCLVEVAMPGRDGVVRPMPKPQPSCAMTAMEGMEISTQATSEVAAKAQAGTMEFLLINHPLDCPVCDKGGECPLQNQALELMASGAQSATRFTDVKRTFPKPLRLTSNILLDRDRCILCQRCVRFADQIPGDPFIALQGRGGGQQVASEVALPHRPLGPARNRLGLSAECLTGAGRTHLIGRLHMRGVARCGGILHRSRARLGCEGSRGLHWGGGLVVLGLRYLSLSGSGSVSGWCLRRVDVPVLREGVVDRGLSGGLVETLPGVL